MQDLSRWLGVQKVVPIIRADTVDQGQRLLEMLYEGGIRLIELTTTVPDVFALVGRMRMVLPDLVIGVGTLHTAEMAQQAVDVGADFLVTYKASQEVARVGQLSKTPYVLGAATPTEVDTCMRLGSEVVKLFPANVLGPDFIHEIQGPIPGVKCFPTGGIGPQTAKDWLAKGALAVGIGSALTSGDQTVSLVVRTRRLLEDLSVDVAVLQNLRQGRYTS
ncbi:MAG: 2-dehydro-3-deoxyphosphogluconate aldolase [Sulfobacillus thermosulfidooxidans]|nr:MAG: 2-dehydro-3-deoxyphosphogluconate aldolase [Sulfobacillus thermosulfidooxidans]